MCGVFIIENETPEEKAKVQEHWDKVMGWKEDGTGANVCDQCFNHYIEWYREHVGMPA